MTEAVIHNAGTQENPTDYEFEFLKKTVCALDFSFIFYFLQVSVMGLSPGIQQSKLITCFPEWGMLLTQWLQHQVMPGMCGATWCYYHRWSSTYSCPLHNQKHAFQRSYFIHYTLTASTLASQIHHSKDFKWRDNKRRACICEAAICHKFIC